MSTLPGGETLGLISSLTPEQQNGIANAFGSLGSSGQQQVAGTTNLFTGTPTLISGSGNAFGFQGQTGFGSSTAVVFGQGGGTLTGSGFSATTGGSGGFGLNNFGYRSVDVETALQAGFQEHPIFITNLSAGRLTPSALTEASTDSASLNLLEIGEMDADVEFDFSSSETAVTVGVVMPETTTDNEVIITGAENILVVGDGALTVGGSEGSLVIGNSGDQIITGGEGADTLIGGSGDDTIMAGEGDIIGIDGGGNKVFGGVDAGATLDFSYLGLTGGLEQLASFVTDVTVQDGNTTVEFGEAGKITLVGVTDLTDIIDQIDM